MNEIVPEIGLEPVPTVALSMFISLGFAVVLTSDAKAAELVPPSEKSDFNSAVAVKNAKAAQRMKNIADIL